jgi:hypothetical protein
MEAIGERLSGLSCIQSSLHDADAGNEADVACVERWPVRRPEAGDGPHRVRVVRDVGMHDKLVCAISEWPTPCRQSVCCLCKAISRTPATLKWQPPPNCRAVPHIASQVYPLEDPAHVFKLSGPFADLASQGTALVLCEHHHFYTSSSGRPVGCMSDYVITFYSPEAVIMTSEDFAPQRGAMHQSSVRSSVKQSILFKQHLNTHKSNNYLCDMLTVKQMTSCSVGIRFCLAP